jgi:hypothetical protein
MIRGWDLQAQAVTVLQLGRSRASLLHEAERMAPVPLQKKLNTKEQENGKKRTQKKNTKKRREAWGDADFSGG